MPDTDPAPPTETPPPVERGAALGLVPLLATLVFYGSPVELQAQTLYQFLPQACAYLALAWWSRLNGAALRRLGLPARRIPQGLRWGLPVGLLLGTVNVLIILYLVPRVGGDYRFLGETPHAKIPLWIMLPWFIMGIALAVEINFRGFFLGRLVAMGLPATAAVFLSALVFAYDPFLAATFRGLHWIALWDGAVWGLLVLTTNNLWIAIVAHAVEVMVLYGVIRAVLS